MSKRSLALVVAGSIPAALFVGSLSPVGEVGLVVLAAVAVLVSRAVPRFRWDLFRGAMAGGVAGLVVLGPGFRLAMRVVAIADADRVPEFTLGGTIFIVIGIGLVLGAAAGAYFVSIGRLLGLGRAPIAFVSTVGLMVFLFADSELRSELLDLGLGGVVNIPMFAMVVFAYGWTLDAIAIRLETRKAHRGRMEAVGVS